MLASMAATVALASSSIPTSRPRPSFLRSTQASRTGSGTARQDDGPPCRVPCFGAPARRICGAGTTQRVGRATSRKRAIGWTRFLPLVPVQLRTGTKGSIGTGSRAQGISAGSVRGFSTGSWYEPVLKVFPPDSLPRWGRRCTFSTGSKHKPVLKGVQPICILPEL